MHVLIIGIGLIVGIIQNFLINSISYKITGIKTETFNIFVPIICSLCYEILFLKLSFTTILIKSIIMTTILIIISFVDIKHKIIPNFMAILTLVVGIVISFAVKTSLIDSVLGMLCGGGIMFIIGLVPNMIGGGDIKLMFALGAFLGANRTLWALLLAFFISAIVGIILIVFKIKARSDYIPFGPFLSLGSFISILIFNV